MYFYCSILMINIVDMKYKFLFILFALSILNHYSFCQENQYWQQYVSYDMDIDMDVNTHRFKGKQTLFYVNNSPDTLYKVFYHLYFNAFQPGSEMDVRSRSLPDPDKRVGDRISKLTPDQIGYHKIMKLLQNDQVTNYKVQGTILEVSLSRPILPGEKTKFYMEFESQIPIQIRRSGRNSLDGIDYSMSQWYPKICAYDIDGWHANPYVGREFYGVFGEYNVRINIDSRYVLGGTGELQNSDEVGQVQSGLSIFSKSSAKTTWHFYASMVHDFMWAADPDYVVEQVQVPDGPMLNFLYQPDSMQVNWKKLQPMMVQFFQLMNKKFGKYPYNTFSFIQGGDGGMEYPMATLITSRGSFEGLVGVSVHEAAHNWYYGILATNESKYPWMDEGFTTYAEDYILNELFNEKNPFPFEGNYKPYLLLFTSADKEPLSTHADFYKKNRTYGISSYSAGAVFLSQLSYIIGQDAFDKGMLRYFNEWKFKHPRPEDFIRIMEKVSGVELDWYLEQFVYSLNTIDYGIQSVSKNEKQTVVTLDRLGDFPMPLDVIVELNNGDKIYHYIPLDLMRGEKKEKLNEKDLVIQSDWPWVNKTYTFNIDQKFNSIKSISINPDKRMADINRENNQWLRKDND